MLSLSSVIQKNLTQSTSPAEQLLSIENQQLKSRNQHLAERNALLEEEVRWLKGQLFGRSSQKGAAEAVSPDQKCTSLGGLRP